MGESQNNSEQPKDNPPSKDSSKSWLQERKAQVASFFKRQPKQAETASKSSRPETKVDDSGFHQLVDQVGQIDRFNSVTFPGHSYPGKDLGTMLQKLYPELQKKLQIDPEKPNDTGNLLLLKGVFAGDKESIIQALDDLERSLELKVNSKTNPHDPNRVNLTYSKNIRALLQEQIERERKAEELEGQELNSQAKDEINQVLAGKLDDQSKEE